jgi:hypothetical protein
MMTVADQPEDHMRISKDDIPVKVQVPGATARMTPDFGPASGVMGAEFFSLGAGTDIAPLLAGLQDDLCHAPHWGYLHFGRLTITYRDGSAETCTTGDLYYWPPGHTVRAEEDSELIMFSPSHEHGEVLDHMLAKLAE